MIRSPEHKANAEGLPNLRDNCAALLQKNERLRLALDSRDRMIRDQAQTIRNLQAVVETLRALPFVKLFIRQKHRRLFSAVPKPRAPEDLTE